MEEPAFFNLYKNCRLCPRKCGADRTKAPGFCRASTRPRIAKAMIHKWEEPVLCGSGGSGAVFFSNCTMRCVYCQNHEISQGGFGKDISVNDLANVFLSLKDEGAENIDLITATHYLPAVICALKKAGPKLNIPIIYNCGGYELPETLKLLKGYVNIYLPDIKYYDDALALKFSAAPDYFETACLALSEMVSQTGKKEAVIVRHMVLPGHKNDSLAVLRNLAERFGTESFLISILRQYTPFYLVKTRPDLKPINRRVTDREYSAVVDEAIRLGFDGFIQEKSSAAEEYTPLFDLGGVP